MGWETICAMIGLVSLFIIILLDMLSRAFSLQSVQMWVKAEYAQVAVTFLLIVFASGMASVGAAMMANIAMQVGGASGNLEFTDPSYIPNRNTPTDIAKGYIDTVVACEANIYKVIYWINIFFEAFSKISFDVAHVEAIGAGIALTGFVTLFHYIMNNIVYLVLFHYIQYNTLLLSQYAMLPIFFPIGLALRAFSLTRGAGGFVVAFSLGFAFVFPMAYVMIVAMMPSTGLMCTQVNVTNHPEMAPFDANQACFNNAGGIISAYYQVKSAEEQTQGIASYVKDMIGLLFLQALFYPLAALIITLTFIRQTGNLFGADLAEIGRGLIKLI